MFKRTKAKKIGKIVKITAMLLDGLIVNRTYFTSSYQEAFLKLEKEFRYAK